MTVKQIFNTNAELDYPTVLPTLDLDFANSKTLDPRITFTRASGGSHLDRNGVIKYAGINEARFDHDPETGESLGLLIEEQRTNLLAWSQNFNNWVRHRDSTEPSNITVTESNELAPDGVSNFFLCTYGSTDLRRAFSGGAGKTYTASCFYKRPNTGDSANFATFQIHIVGGITKTAGVTYSFNTGSIISSFGSVSVGFQKYPNGVVRLWLTVTDDGDGTGVFFLNLRGGQGATGKSILTWGAQIEEGFFPTSYIPTLGSTRTRAADNASITGKNFSDFYRQDEGTFFSNTKINGVQFGRFDRLWAITNSNFNFEGISLFVSGPLSGRYISSISATNNAIGMIGRDSSAPNAATTPELSSAFAFKQNDSASSYNGRQIYVDNTVNLSLFTTPIDRLFIGRPQRFQGHSCMTIRRVIYFPKRLPNAQLQALTK